MGGRAATIFAALGVALLSVAPSSPAVSVIPGGEQLQGKFMAIFSPKTLSKTERTPVAVRAAARFWSGDGSQVPALEQLRLRFDRHLRLDLGEVATCSFPGLGRPEPERTCRDAIVARGRMKVAVSFPDAGPLSQTTKATVFKGDASKGGSALFLYASFVAPIAGEFVAPILVKRPGDDRYGLELVAEIPKIAGGFGSITHLGLRFDRGVFDATCPRRGSLQAAFEAGFADGAELNAVHLRFCD